MSKDYIIIKIDVERDTNGEAVQARLTGGKSTGLPWSTILDSSGKELITGSRPTDKGDQNIGCPVSPEERDWFVTMISKTSQHMSDANVALIGEELATYAKELGR